MAAAAPSPADDGSTRRSKQPSATLPESPLGSLAVQVEGRAPCAIVSVMSVSVNTGLTAVHPPLGQPTADPDTVDGAVRTAGFVVK